MMPRFFYHVILNEHIEKLNTSNAARPALTRVVLNKIRIPVPPMEIQHEIVRVLDSFAELEAELEARRRQYAYYRDKLLDFTERESVSWLKLGDVLVDLRTGLNPRKNFILNTAHARNDYITVRELGGKRIVVTEKTDKVDDEALALIQNRA